MIIYFSSTGNSLSVAKELSAEINEYAIHINKAMKQGGGGDKIIGLVFPTHYNDIPELVQKFIKEFDFGSPDYIFGIVTHGGDPGNSLFTLKRLLKERGLDLFYGNEIRMPVNSRVMYGGVATNIEELISNQKGIIKEITSDILNKKNNTNSLKEKTIAKFVYNISTTKFVRNFFRLSVNKEKCTKCGTCVKVCPVDNIKMDENGIKFGDHCENCFTCVHWCPTAAINIRKRETLNKHQYHHPGVNLNEIMDK